MTSQPGNGKAPPAPPAPTLPPPGCVEVAHYDVLLDAGGVIGTLADEMAVYFRGRWIRDSGNPTDDFEDIRIWVPEADADRARQRLGELVPAPPTEEDFERVEDLSPSEFGSARALRGLFATLLVYAVVTAAIVLLARILYALAD